MCDNTICSKSNTEISMQTHIDEKSDIVLKNLLLNFHGRNRQIRLATNCTLDTAKKAIADKLKLFYVVITTVDSVESPRIEDNDTWQTFFSNADDYDMIYIWDFSLDVSKIKLIKKN